MSGFIRLTSGVAHDYPLSVYVRPESVGMLLEQRSGTLVYIAGEQKGALVKETPVEVMEKLKGVRDGVC